MLVIREILPSCVYVGYFCLTGHHCDGVFSRSAMTSSFSQVNERNGEEITVEQVGNKVNVKYKKDTQSKLESESVKLESGMVVDAGFDGFIRKYWSTLVSGKQMDIQYLVSTELTTFSFRIKKSASLDGTSQRAVCYASLGERIFVIVKANIKVLILSTIIFNCWETL